MYTENYFIQPNIFHSDETVDGYCFVTGESPLSAGAKLLGLIAENSSGSTAWIQVHDGYQEPDAGAVPIVSLKATTGQQVSLDCQAFNCIPVSLGIVVALSSTNSTYTAVAPGMWLSAFWI